MPRLRLIAVVLCGLATASCFTFDAGRESISSNNPDQLIPAIKRGVAAHDRSIIPYLVKDLCSEDSAVRFYAIDGLQRLTGQDMGYLFYADDDARKPAVERWKAWLAQHPVNAPRSS